MNPPTGAQIALNIEFLADSYADRAEFDLSVKIRESAAKHLLVPETLIPQRLINSFSRGSTQVGKDQAIREIQLLLASVNTSPNDALLHFDAISKEVSEKRKQAHKLRSQLSSIRSLLKVLDPTRTSSIVQAMSPRHEETRLSLVNQMVDSVNRLQYWSEEVAHLFEEVNRSTGSIDNSRIRKVRVSDSAVRNYVAIFKTFVARNASQLLDLASENLDSNPSVSSINLPTTTQTSSVPTNFELVIELLNAGSIPFEIKKRWTDKGAAKAELSNWLKTPARLIGENGRVDQVKINLVTDTGEEVFTLKEAQLNSVESLIEGLLN